MPGGVRANQTEILGAAVGHRAAGRAQLRGEPPVCVPHPEPPHSAGTCRGPCDAGTCQGRCHRAAGGRASPCARSQDLMLPLQAGTPLCSSLPSAGPPKPSLGSPWKHRARRGCFPHGCLQPLLATGGKGRALQNPQPKKKKPKCSSGDAQGLPMPSAACPALLPCIPGGAMPGLGPGFLAPSPREWAATLSRPSLSFARASGSRKGSWGEFLSRGAGMWVTRSPAHPAGHGSEAAAGFGLREQRHVLGTSPPLPQGSRRVGFDLGFDLGFEGSPLG